MILPEFLVLLGVPSARLVGGRVPCLDYGIIAADALGRVRTKGFIELPYPGGHGEVGPGHSAYSRFLLCLTLQCQTKSIFFTGFLACQIHFVIYQVRLFDYPSGKRSAYDSLNFKGALLGLEPFGLDSRMNSGPCNA
jgi:hypothetical protein